MCNKKEYKIKERQQMKNNLQEKIQVCWIKLNYLKIF